MKELAYAPALLTRLLACGAACFAPAAWGSNSQSRVARQQVPHQIYKDANGVEHVRVSGSFVPCKAENREERGKGMDTLIPAPWRGLKVQLGFLPVGSIGVLTSPK